MLAVRLICCVTALSVVLAFDILPTNYGFWVENKEAWSFDYC